MKKPEEPQLINEFLSGNGTGLTLSIGLAIIILPMLFGSGNGIIVGLIVGVTICGFAYSSANNGYQFKLKKYQEFNTDKEKEAKKRREDTSKKEAQENAEGTRLAWNAKGSNPSSKTSTEVAKHFSDEKKAPKQILSKQQQERNAIQNAWKSISKTGPFEGGSYTLHRNSIDKKTTLILDAARALERAGLVTGSGLFDDIAAFVIGHDASVVSTLPQKPRNKWTAKDYQFFHAAKIEKERKGDASAIKRIENLVLDADVKFSILSHISGNGSDGYDEGMPSNNSELLSSGTTKFGLKIGNTGVNSQPIFVKSEKSLITIAGPGSGKTQCHVLPNLNSFKGAAIVLDIKGECALNSAKWRKDNIGSVILFAPAHSATSQRYNPLSFVSQDPNVVWEDSRLLAELLVVPKSQSDPTWENQARQFLTLLIAYVVYLPDDRRNMSSVLDLLNDMGLDKALENVLIEGAPFPSAMRRTANNFKRMKETAEKQFSGVVSGALQHLGVWEGPLVESLTSVSDWSPLDFRNAKPPTLYLIIPPNQIETYAPLVRVIIAQHVRMLMQEEPDREAPPVLFMLDELPRLGKMEPIREALEVGRSYRLQLWMFAQFAGQLHDAYGKEIAEGMIESCGVRMYMNAGQDTADKLSKALGTRENMLTGKTEPVVTPQALTGPEWKDDILVFATGEKPLRLKKSFFHEQQQQ